MQCVSRRTTTFRVTDEFRTEISTAAAARKKRKPSFSHSLTVWRLGAGDPIALKHIRCVHISRHHLESIVLARIKNSRGTVNTRKRRVIAQVITNEYLAYSTHYIIFHVRYRYYTQKHRKEIACVISAQIKSPICGPGLVINFPISDRNSMVINIATTPTVLTVVCVKRSI